MKHESIDGLVLRAQKTGENDVYLSILTAERGRFGLLAKGARSIKGDNLSICQPFTLANFEYYSRTSLNVLKGGRIGQSFFNVVDGEAEPYLAFYLCDLACELSDEEVEAGDLLRLTLNALYALSKMLYPEERVKAAFELRAMALSGYAPALSACDRCGKALDGNAVFNVSDGTLVCRDCLSRTPSVRPEEDVRAASTLLPLSPAVLAAMRYCVSAPLSRIFSFSLEEAEDLRLFSRVAESYVLEHLERGFDTLRFYYQMKEEPDLSIFGVQVKP